MKNIIFSLFLSMSFSAFAIDGADDVHLDFKPAIGIGVNTDGIYATGKVSLIKLGMPQEKVQVKFIGIGYSVGEVEGISLTPVIIKYNNIGIGLDFSLKNKSEAGLSLNYCF